MALKRYEVSEAQWSKIAFLLPGKAGDPGSTVLDNRLFVIGCLWVLRSGAHWRDLPERYGKWRTVHRRFIRWCHAGVWDRVFDALTADRDNQYLVIDRTIVRAHQQAATGKGGPRSGVGAFPRWINDQDPHADRRARPASPLRRHRRTGRRYHASASPARRPDRHRGSGRQSL